MHFPYHQIEEDSIESVGNIQSGRANHETIEDESVFSPPRPLLPYWPSCLGYFQIAIGFLCAGFGSVQVFVIPIVINVEAEIGLYRLNCYGAAIWCGFLLILSGSCAVRASRKKDLTSVIQFYMTTLFSFLACLAMIILILWCYIDIPELDSVKCNILPGDNQEFAEVLEKVHKYSVISLMSAVWCLIGCLFLFLSMTNYFCPVMFGEVHLMKKLGVCWLPCFFYLPPKKTLDTMYNHSSDDSSLNVIV